MLILGGRYGSIEEESELSYTELEYKYALSKNMPVFAIILEDSFLFTKAASMGKDNIFEKDNLDKYDAFKELIKTNLVKFVKNIDQIAINIHSQLNDILNDTEYNLIGWIRNTSENNISQLLKENFTLKQELNLLKTQAISTNIDKLGNYSFDELVNLFKNKIFTIDAKKLLRIKNGGTITALNLFILYYDYFVTGVPNNLFSNEYSYLYNFIIPYFVSFQLLDKKNTKPEKFQITSIGCSFYAMLESKGMTQK